jgi:hypothetical protein
MDPIHVPGPPKEAFNKNRRVSDLIRAQVNHLKHIESKLPANLRQGIPQHPIVTEDDAARYIAPMTRLLRAQAAAAPQAASPSAGPMLVPSAPPAASTAQPAQGLDLAASASNGKIASKGKGPATKSATSKPKPSPRTPKGKKP